MAYTPVQLGQQTSASSSPVVIASDQTKIPVNFDSMTQSVSWTSASPVPSTLQYTNVANYGTAVVTAATTGGSIATGSIGFNVYDGTNWYPVQGQQIGTYNTQASYTLALGNIAWQFDIGGFRGFQVALTGTISGTGSPSTAITMDVMAGTNDVAVTVGQSSASNLNAAVSGPTAALSNLTANPLTIGGAAFTGGSMLNPATANTQVVNSMMDKYGRGVMIPQATRDIIGVSTGSSTTGSATLISPIANIYTDIAEVWFSNTSGTSTYATLTDGTNNYVVYIPSGDTRGLAAQVPLPATNASHAWTLSISTAVSSIYYHAVYIKNQ